MIQSYDSRLIDKVFKLTKADLETNSHQFNGVYYELIYNNNLMNGILLKDLKEIKVDEYYKVVGTIDNKLIIRPIYL